MEEIIKAAEAKVKIKEMRKSRKGKKEGHSVSKFRE